MSSLDATAGASVRELEPGVTQIDHHFRGIPGIIASYVVQDGGDAVLIEAGPASTTTMLLAGLRAADIDPASISRIVVTHIHLDHAGAAGLLLRDLPRARLLVHPKGAAHLVDPSKLLASAQRIYGALMKPLWGEVLPVPADRMDVVQDDEAIVVGGRTLRALDTPGHAVHHHALLDESSGTLFTGDVAGIRLDGAPYVRPPTPPPELDPEAWRASVTRLRALRPRRLCLTHFGAVDDVEWHFDELLTRLFHWKGWLGVHLDEGRDPEAITDALRVMERASLAEAGVDDAVFARYEAAGNYRMGVDGFARYFRKRADRGAPPSR